MHNGVMKAWLESSHLAGANATYVEDLYELYLSDPDLVSDEWKHVFEGLPTQASEGEQPHIRPLPGLPVVRDLIVDMTQFYDNYAKVKPYLINDGELPPAREHLQSPEDRAHLDGLYDCIMCACCTTACPSFWWNPDKFIGPAGLLAAYRWLIDSRDTATDERLSNLDDAFSVFRCHEIMNCVNVCPKGLNPTKAIGHIKSMLIKRSV